MRLALPPPPLPLFCAQANDVQAATQEMTSAPHALFLRALSRLEKLALVGLMVEARAAKRGDTTVQVGVCEGEGQGGVEGQESALCCACSEGGG